MSKKEMTDEKRYLWWEAMEISTPLLEGVRKIKGVTRAEIAGSFRRKSEIVSDLDFLVASSHPKAVMEWFRFRPEVNKVLFSSDTKGIFLLTNGIHADVFMVPENEFECALLSLTGSQTHLLKLTKLARKQGLILKQMSEADIYQKLGLQYIPPELREGRGEIEAAKRENPPFRLVELKDIKGTFHNHTSASDGEDNLLNMVRAAEKLKWEYIGISDHSKACYQANGLSDELVLSQIEHIQKLNAAEQFRLTIFSGTECDILPNGRLDFPDSILKRLDYVIVSVHNALTQDEKTMTNRIIKAIEHPFATILGHLTGRRLLRHPGYKVNIQKVIDACIANKKMIELNGAPLRLELDWRFWHNASQKGLLCCVNTDAHSIEGHRFVETGINMARKGWLQKEQIFNTRPLSEVIRYFRRVGS